MLVRAAMAGLLVGLVACGSGTAVTSSGGGPPATGGMGGTGGTGTGADDGGGGEGGEGGEGGSPKPVLPCVDEAGDHSVICDGTSPCPILVDRVIRCESVVFGQSGVPVVATPDDVVAMAIGLHRDAHTWTVTADAATRHLEIPQVPFQTSALAVDTTGTVHVAVWTQELGALPTDPSETLMLRREAGVFVAESAPLEILRGDPQVVDAMGIHHLFGWQIDGILHLFGTPSGGWQSEPLEAPVGASGFEPGVAASGLPFASGWVDKPGFQRQLAVRIGGQTKQLGSVVPDYESAAYQSFGGPVPPDPAIFAPYGAVFARNAGLAVSWAGNTGWGEIAVPDTSASTPVCSEFLSPPCPASCHEVSSGLDQRAFDMVRAPDGSLWLAYLITHYDMLRIYETQQIEGQDVCVGQVKEDASTFELVLVRVPLGTGGPVTELLRFPMSEGFGDLFQSKPHRHISAHAYGNELAIGLRMDDPDPEKAAMRVLRIDMSAL
ncbi:MAG: hypothetical protein R3B72_17880 [Polyangiaceae bacterium]